MPAETPAPSSSPDSDNPAALSPAFGWTRYAERLNGRFAMVGFIALLVLETVTQQSFWSWIGLL